MYPESHLIVGAHARPDARCYIFIYLPTVHTSRYVQPLRATCSCHARVS
jgi:hypothetical protein